MLMNLWNFLEIRKLFHNIKLVVFEIVLRNQIATIVYADYHKFCVTLWMALRG